MAVSIETIEWGGWPNCHRIANDEVDLIVTADIGPRIMRYGFIEGQNLLKVFEDQQGKSGEPAWQLRGGHRLWRAPEDRILTYAPDNTPIEIETNDGVLTATQPVEPLTGLRKQLVIRLADHGTKVEVLHRIQNTLCEAREISIWALSMMAPGGTAITGFPPRGTHPEILAPTNPLVMWAFTNLTDKRWTFLEKYLLLRQDPAIAAPTKLGHFNKDTWGAYLLGSELFLKRCAADPAKSYPDLGCSCELFANEAMLEIETLGPLTHLEPNAWLEHVEHWSLHRNAVVPEWTDPAVDQILKLVKMERTA